MDIGRRRRRLLWWIVSLIAAVVVSLCAKDDCQAVSWFIGHGQTAARV